MSVIEAAAVLAGLLSVVLLVRQNILCWPAGLVQVLLYALIFYQERLYSGVILQAVYVLTQLYGWLHWRRAGSGKAALPVSTLGGPGRLAWPLLTLAGTVVWGLGMDRYTDAAAPYPDAFIALCSLAAQWLMVHKKLENWLFWIAVDIVAIALYWRQGLQLTTLLYAVFMGLSTVGFLSWRQDLREAQVASGRNAF